VLPPVSARSHHRTRAPRTRIAGSLVTAAATVAAVTASLAAGGGGAPITHGLLAAVQISPDARDAMRGEHAVPAAPPAPAPATASAPAPGPDVAPVVAQVRATAPSVTVQALAVSHPVPVAVAPAAPPAPLLRNMLISDSGGLRTGVGVYSDCSGRTALTHAVAAIDTCVAGPTYFVGHDPGVFTPLMSMSVGDVITWYDRNGAAHPMRIVSIRDGYASANGAPRPTQAGVVAQFQTCEPYSPSGDYDRIIDTVNA
jgi:hypothetical protein